MPNLVIRPNIVRPLNTLSPATRPVIRPNNAKVALDTFSPSGVSSITKSNTVSPVIQPPSTPSTVATTPSSNSGIGGFFSSLWSGFKHWLGGLFGQAQTTVNQQEPGLVSQATSWVSNFIGGLANKAMSWLDKLLGGVQNDLNQ